MAYLAFVFGRPRVPWIHLLTQVAVSKGDKLNTKLSRCVMPLPGRLLWWMAQPVDEKSESTAGKWQRRLEAAQTVALVGLAALLVEAQLDEQLHTPQV